MHRLSGAVQHFAWGNRTEIPRLLGIEPDGQPWAEYWLGAHHAGPTHFPDNPSETLASHLERYPENIGKASIEAYGTKLPYLMKILSAAGPLSLQVHPTREQALAGYAQESLAGLPLSHPERSYKDDWPKPEIIIALTPFEGLVGFRDPFESATLFEALGAGEELAAIIEPLREHTEQDALQKVFLDALTLREHRDLVNLVLSRAAELLDAPGAVGEFARTAIEINEHFPGDPGILAALLMNRVTLAPGEAVALEAGVLHAYLRGTGIEVMASSDNVLRGGLTTKHIDVDGLQGLVSFRTLHPQVQLPDGSEGLFRYPTTFPEFEVWLLTPTSDACLIMPREDAGRIALVTEGEFVLDGDQRLTLSCGEAVFIPAGEHVAASGTGQLFVSASGI